jgi:hypothetical protein
MTNPARNFSRDEERLIRFAGDPTWPAAADPPRGAHSTTVAIALVNHAGTYYLFALDDKGGLEITVSRTA